MSSTQHEVEPRRSSQGLEFSSRLTQLLRVRELNVFIALLVVGALISFSTPYFLTTDNLMGVFRAFSMTAIMSIGMVMVIITGGIDLSVGSAMGLASLVTALCFDYGAPISGWGSPSVSFSAPSTASSSLESACLHSSLR
jgi:ribose transport system permease protein